VLIVNEHEATEVAGVGDLSAAIEQLAERFPDVVVTLGEQGAVVVQGANRVQVPAFPVRAVDAVAAGDTFCGVYAVGLAVGQDVEFALRRASAAAALTCTRPGPRNPCPPGTRWRRWRDPV
jgi:ribokinase